MKKILLATAYAAAQIATSVPAAAQTAGEQKRRTAAHEFDEIVVTAERRRTDLQKTPIAATVMTGEKVANTGVTVVDQLQFISPGGDGQQLRPGHRLQHPRHRQGRAQHADHHGRDHLSRRRGDLSRATSPPSRTTTSRAWKSCAVRRAPSSARTPRAARCSSPRNDPIINGGYTGYIQGAGRQLQRLRRAGRDQSAGRRHLRGARRVQRREARQLTTTSKVRTPATTACRLASGRLGMLWEPSENLRC